MDASKRHHLSVLNGPPGSGKQTLLAQACPNLEVMMLETVVNESNVAKILMLLQPTIVQGGFKKVVWAIKSAELISTSAIAALSSAVKRVNRL